MSVHECPPPEPSAWGPLQPEGAVDLDALLAAWGEAIRLEGRSEALEVAGRALRSLLEERDRELTTLRQAAHVLSATTRLEAIATLARDLLRELLKGGACGVWMLGEDAYEPRASQGLDRTQPGLRLPVPNPLPELPILLGQWQPLERSALPEALAQALGPLGNTPLFLPMDHQGLLAGFALLDAPVPVGSLVDTLELLLRLFGGAAYQSWQMNHLSRQREELEHASLQLTERMDQLRRENTALTEGQGYRMDFLGFALDQLRPILGSLLGTMTRLKQDPDLGPEGRGNLLLEGLLQGKRMAEFLRDLSEVAQGRRREPLGPPLPVDLEVLLTEIRPAVENLPRGPESEVDWPDVVDLPEILACGETLRHVLLALCQGAVRLSPTGSIHLWVEREPLHLVLRLLLEGLEVEPSDPSIHRTGSLKASEFYTKGKGSHGLGLVIAEHLVREMKGSLRLDRDFFGQGAVISLAFPLA